jgi:hypothetical protein
MFVDFQTTAKDRQGIIQLKKNLFRNLFASMNLNSTMFDNLKSRVEQNTLVNCYLRIELEVAREVKHSLFR